MHGQVNIFCHIDDLTPIMCWATCQNVAWLSHMLPAFVIVGRHLGLSGQSLKWCIDGCLMIPQWLLVQESLQTDCDDGINGIDQILHKSLAKSSPVMIVEPTATRCLVLIGANILWRLIARSVPEIIAVDVSKKQNCIHTKPLQQRPKHNFRINML